MAALVCLVMTFLAVQTPALTWTLPEQRLIPGYSPNVKNNLPRLYYTDLLEKFYRLYDEMISLELREMEKKNEKIVKINAEDSNEYSNQIVGEEVCNICVIKEEKIIFNADGSTNLNVTSCHSRMKEFQCNPIESNGKRLDGKKIYEVCVPSFKTVATVHEAHSHHNTFCEQKFSELYKNLAKQYRL